MTHLEEKIAGEDAAQRAAKRRAAARRRVAEVRRGGMQPKFLWLDKVWWRMKDGRDRRAVIIRYPRRGEPRYCVRVVVRVPRGRFPYRFHMVSEDRLRTRKR